MHVMDPTNHLEIKHSTLMYVMDPTNKALYSYVCDGPNKPLVKHSNVCYGPNKPLVKHSTVMYVMVMYLSDPKNHL